MNGASEQDEQATPYVAPAALWERPGRGDPQVVIDVRSADEYAVGHVPGARHIPLDQLAGRLAELPVGRPVVTYCTMRHRGDSRGGRAAALLRERGFQAHALDGGLPAWAAAGYPVERGPHVTHDRVGDAE